MREKETRVSPSRAPVLIISLCIKTVMHRILFSLLTFITRNTSDYAAKMENMNGGMKNGNKIGMAMENVNYYIRTIRRVTWEIRHFLC